MHLVPQCSCILTFQIYLDSIRDVIMDIAEDRPTNQDRAYAVENCVCPQGYRGQSCEVKLSV